jgi:small-conductance mechanosensitive channel
VVSLAIGFTIDTILYRVIRAQTQKRNLRAGDAIARSLHGLPTYLSALIAARIIIGQLGLSDRQYDTAQSIMAALAILGVTWSATRMAGRLTIAVTERPDNPIPSSTIFVNLARGAVVAVGTVSVLAALGVSIGPMVAALGVGGIAIGLALQPTLENLFAGIQVLMSRQIEPGDFVRLESGEEGHVQDMNWRNTTIKMLSNDLIIVPNSVIGKSRIVNFTSVDEQHIIWVGVSVAYDSDLDQVERVCTEVAHEVLETLDCAVTDFEPLLRFEEFGDSGIQVRVALKSVSYADRGVVRTAFIKRLHSEFAAQGIHIPYPQRTVHMATPLETGQIAE